MQPREARALGELAGATVSSVVTRVGQMHQGIAERVFGSIGAGAESVRVVHDGIARGAYAGLRGSLRAAARAGASAASLAGSPEDPPVELNARARVAIGALNGAFGDQLEEIDSPLAVEMSVARPVRDPGPRVAVFLHGLCETEDAWWLHADRHRPYGPALQEDLGYTPVYIRYNSGRRICANGRDLARLLVELDRDWPVEIDEIALISHSMGGLIARSACHQAAGERWVTRVRHVFMLACPHLGAPLERAVKVASAGLATLPETRTFSNALNLRSVGIKDLHDGTLLEEELEEVPFLTTANHYFFSASLNGLTGRLVGDLLVLGPSAWNHRGRGQRLTFPLDHYRHLDGANHFDLLNHPAVYEQIRKWIERPLLCEAPQR